MFSLSALSPPTTFLLQTTPSIPLDDVLKVVPLPNPSSVSSPLLLQYQCQQNQSAPMIVDPLKILLNNMAQLFEPIMDQPMSSDDLPITLRKRSKSTRNPRPIHYFLSFNHLSLSYFALVLVLSSVTIPKIVHEELAHPVWKQVMIDNMQTLESLDLVCLQPGKRTDGCRLGVHYEGRL